MGTRFEEVVNADIYNACWRYCCRLSTDSHSAEDLLQEALVRAYLRIGQLKDRSKAKGWLFAIVRTTYIDRLRQSKSRPDAQGFDSAGNLAASTPPKTGTLTAALQGLPERQRELIELFHFDNLSLAETAQALGIRVNTVKQRLLRARAALKRLLDPAFESGELEELF